MKYRASSLVVGAAALLLSGPTLAGNLVQCPDLSQAQQLGDCPVESEVKRLFKISCDFEGDPNAKNPELCDSYKEYKRRKFNALWESADQEFMGYVNCSLPAAEVKKGKPTGVAVSQKNGLHKVVCSYDTGARLTMRTRKVCQVPGKRDPLITVRAKCDAGKPCAVECD